MATADGRKLGPRPATKDRLRKKKAVRIEHQVVEDNAYAEKLREARAEMERAEAKWKGLANTIDSKKGDEKVRQAQEAEQARFDYDAARIAFEEAQIEAAAHTYTLVFVGLGAHKLDILNRQHRPTEEDIARWRDEMGMSEEEIKQQDRSPTTFPPCLIAASMVEPQLTEDEVRELIWDSDNFNEAERIAVLMAATRAQGTIARVDLGPTFGASPSAKPSSDSPTGSGNPAASS